MKKNIRNIYLFGLLAILSSLNWSCKKFIEIDPPATQLASNSVFTTDQTALSAGAGLMTTAYTSSFGLSYFYWAYGGLSSDELVNPTVSSYDVYKNNAIPVADGNVGALWSSTYAVIYRANSIIEGLQNSTGVSASVKNQLIGEAKFIRAFSHFYLANTFGDVPLITTTNVPENASAPRTAKAQVIQQVITDLTDAQSLLLNDYSFSANERTRPNKWVATAMLARVYLYNGDWAKAEAQATSVINSGTFSLLSDLNTVFYKNSNEAIFQFNTTNQNLNGATYEGSFIHPSTSPPAFVLTSFLQSAFEAGDQRAVKWIAPNSSPNKYKLSAAPTGTAVPEYYMVLRFAEQYLIRAEARAQQNNVAGAASDINVIRTRAGLPNTTASTQPAMLLAIEHERQVELFAEWGHRWNDLIRTGRADIVLAAEKGALWSAKAKLFPIPVAEILKNSNLVQNPGY